MNVALVAFLIISILTARYWYGLKSHHRVWAAQVEGRSIEIVVQETTCSIFIDGTLVLNTPIERSMRMVHTPTGIRPRQSFRYNIEQQCSALGGKMLRFESDWYHSNQGSPVFKYDLENK